MSYTLEDLKKENWKRLNLWEKILWIYWDTPFSIMWWQNKIEEYKLRKQLLEGKKSK